MEKDPSVRIVLAEMGMLEQVVRNLLTDQRGIQLDDEAQSLEMLQRQLLERSVIVIRADPRAFAKACEALPNVRLVGIADDWRQAMVRFSDMTMEGLRDAILYVASTSKPSAMTGEAFPGEVIAKETPQSESQERGKTLSSESAWPRWATFKLQPQSDQNHEVTPAKSKPVAQDARKSQLREPPSKTPRQKEPAPQQPTVRTTGSEASDDARKRLELAQKTWFHRKPPSK